MHKRLLMAFCPALFSLLIVAIVSDANDELDRLLKRLELKNLQATLIERKLAVSINQDQQKELQRDLTQLYLDQLGELVEQPEAFDKVFDRLVELETVVDQLKEPATRFRLLENRFRYAEFLLNQYRENRKLTKSLADASRAFTELKVEFLKLEARCEKKIESLDKLDYGTNSLENLRADEQIDELSEISFRSAFYSGWSAFHAGMTKQSATLAETFFRESYQSFCVFLEIDPKEDIRKLDDSFLDLESIRSSQALLGIALSLLGLGQNGDADHCFELIRREQTPASVRDQIPFWQIQTLLDLGEIEDGVQLTEAYLKNASNLNAVQKGQISLFLIRYAYSDSKPDEMDRKLGMLGCRTLAQLRQFDLLNRLVKEHEIILSRPSFYSSWIDGQRLYNEAEKSGLETDYQKASEELQKAVQLETGIPVADLERCRYQLGWALYRSGKYNEAARQFEQVATRIARLDPDSAVNALWLQHDCYLKQTKSDLPRALTALEQLRTRFPESKLAKKAQLQIVKLQQETMDKDAAVKQLKKVVESSPDDLFSKYELGLATYRQFLNTFAEKKNTAAIVVELNKLIEELKKEGAKLTADQSLKLVLIQLDVLLRNKSSDVSRMNSLLNEAEKIATGVTNLNLLAELRYRDVQIARLTGNKTRLEENVEWLVENGEGTVYQRSVLVTRIQQLENQLKSLTDAGKRKETVEKLIGVYQKLANASGYNAKSISSNKNAKVAVTRLAALLEETGDLDGAERNLELLIKAFPNKGAYLLSYATILTKSKKYSEAIDLWRRLTRGLPKESDDWFRAKYNQIKCLSELEKENAVATLKQFRGLYSPKDPWNQRFDDLARELGVD